MKGQKKLFDATIMLALPVSVKEKLAKIANDESTTISEVVRRIIRGYMEANNK